MQILISSQQIRRFQENQCIILEEFLAEGELPTLKRHVAAPSSPFDLFRDDPFLRPWVLGPNVGGVFSPLASAPSLRLAFDCRLDAKTPHPETLFASPCIQGLLGGLIICLESSPFLPLQPRDALFFMPHYPLPWPLAEGSYYLIAFAKIPSVYISAPKENPLLPLFQKRGYSYGDLLRHQDHPIFTKK